MDTFTLPAGTYVIGDPCYSVPKDQWSDILDQTDYFDKPKGFFKDDSGNEIKVIAFTTMYGDGRFQDTFDNYYPVDAGLIGIMPVGDYPVGNGCHTFTYPEAFLCKKIGSTLIFGHIVIETGDIEYEEEEYYDEN